MNTNEIPNEEFVKLKISSIAEKHGCTPDYVRKVLKGERSRKTVVALKIIKDATDMLEVLNRETTITV